MSRQATSNHPACSAGPHIEPKHRRTLNFITVLYVMMVAGCAVLLGLVAPSWEPVYETLGTAVPVTTAGLLWISRHAWVLGIALTAAILMLRCNHRVQAYCTRYYPGIHIGLIFVPSMLVLPLLLAGLVYALFPPIHNLSEIISR